MTSLPYRRGRGPIGGARSAPAWSAYPPEPRSAETEDRWQRHVMILLGVVIALLIVVGGALLYAKMHGVFEPTPSRGKPAEPWGAPPWPEGS